ncbi:DUF6493 family protein [Planobispora siamensis]|uniref:Secreted protein n=1 Tax=Planobispora siamensis TaxID=936338 RepID=A0A8J3SFF0_9ACTN|nr:DUF6493 family protein [Planobispora siamensis]GIH93596.1 hypothetical protein Psi01_42260 [Planobispora siamensis]
MSEAGPYGVQGAWAEIRELIGSGRTGAVAERVATLSAAERREIAAELPGHLRAMWATREVVWADLGARGEAMLVAGAGTIGGAAAAASWLGRAEFTSVRGAGPLAGVLARRPREWQADVVVRLASRVRPDRDASLVLDLLRALGVEPPPHDPLVVAWANERGAPREGGLAGDPLLAVMAPRLFEAEGVGRSLSWDDGNRYGSLLARLVRAAADGTVSREMLLDGCVRRFLRGGEAADLRFFVRLHRALGPLPAETAVHTRDYLRLIPAAPGPVAELALRHAREAPGLAELDPADLVEGVESAVFRPERKLARAGLTWLDRAVRREPGLAGDLAPALATALGHEESDVREYAARIAVKHAGRFTPPAAELLTEAVAALPPDPATRLTAARLAVAFGSASLASVEASSSSGSSEAWPVAPGRSAPQEEPVPPELPAPPPILPLPPPPGTAEELDLLRDSGGWAAAERCLAGFVRLLARDPGGLRAYLEANPPRPGLRIFRKSSWRWVDDWICALCWEVAEPGAEQFWSRPPQVAPRTVVIAARRDEEARGPGRAARRIPGGGTISAPHRVLLLRCAEIFDALVADRLPPLLLATPTLSSGHLEAEELLARLEELEAAGTEPLEADFQQALLRLPRQVDAEVVTRAERLTSRAGRRAARRLAEGPLPDPVVTVRWNGAADGRTEFLSALASAKLYGHRTDRVSVEAVPTGLHLVDALMGGAGREPGDGGHMGWWAAVMPSHREVVAAHLLAYLLPSRDRAGAELRSMAELAWSDGPDGPALALLIAHRLTGHDRDAALSELLTLAARGRLPAADLGEQLAYRVRWDGLALGEIIPVLAQAAHQGAYRDVWRVVAAMLPRLLPVTGQEPPRGLPGLAELGVATAGWAGARGEIPEVAAAAVGAATNRLTRQCRRLHAFLTRS